MVGALHDEWLKLRQIKEKDEEKEIQTEKISEMGN